MTIITSGPTSVAVTTHLRIGGLDYASSTRLREVLSSCGSRPDTHLLVNLRRADGDHDMTFYALLAEKARAVKAVGVEMTVVPCSARLAHLLAGLDVPVIDGPLPRMAVGSADDIGVGQLDLNHDMVTRRAEASSPT